MITYQVETLDECLDDIQPLLEAHYQEICSHPDLLVLDPNYDKYRDLERLGVLRICTARHGDELIGYFISLITPHLHYQQTTYAFNDILYLDPAHRGGRTGYQLFEAAIRDLKGGGVDVVVVHMKTAHPFRPLLARMGFQLTEENWEKVI